MRTTSRAALLSLGLAACGGGGGQGTPTPTPAGNSAVQNALRGIERSTVEKTRSDMNAIGTAIGSHVSGVGSLPAAANLDELSARLAPTYIHVVPRTDAWGNPLSFAGTEESWSVSSRGADGKEGTADDMTLSDAGWVKLPEGYRPVF